MNRMITIVVVLVFGMASPSPALMRPELSLGVRLGTGVFESNKAFGEDTDIENATVIGATVGLRKGPVGGEIAVDRIVVDLKTDIDKGDLRMIPILLTAHWHPLPEERPLDLYLGAGVGYYLNSAHASSEARDLASPLGYSLRADDAVGFHLAVGANIKASSAFAFVVDARYAFMSTDLKIDEGPFTDSSNLDLNGLIITGGVKYLFPR